MSVYKVPQDVEADDKLLGPFSPRQFVYLLVTAGLIGLAWLLFTVYPGLIIIPLPFIIFFGALALPLRKEQPMEAYFAAVISFHLKPNKRLWQPEGKEHLIEIAAPKNPEPDRIKNIRQDEAVRRLSYLADIVDTEGWAIKHAVSATHGQSANPIDVSENPILNRNIDNMLADAENRRKAEILQNMNTARNMADFSGLNAGQIQQRIYTVDPMNLYANQKNSSQNQTPTSTGQTFFTRHTVNPQPITTSNVVDSWRAQQNAQFNPQASSQISNNSNNFEMPEPKLNFNPYPEGVHQSVIQPISTTNPQSFPQNYPQPQAQQIPNLNLLTPAPHPENPQISPEVKQKLETLVEDGKDLSVETLARQANKISQSEGNLGEEEVIISLR